MEDVAFKLLFNAKGKIIGVEDPKKKKVYDLTKITPENFKDPPWEKVTVDWITSITLASTTHIDKNACCIRIECFPGRYCWVPCF